jgi:hypothetical protein
LAEPQVEGLTVLLDGRVTPGCADDPIGKLVIEWGDGNAASLPAGGLPARHIYAQAGAYTITARAISQAGRESMAQRSVALRQSAPTLPNLVAKIIRAPDKATCGQQLGDGVTIQVANTGNGEAAGFYVSLYLSEDEKITSQDHRLSPAVRPDPSATPTLRTTAASGITYIEGLPAGKSVELAMRGANQIPASLPEGTREYWLGVIVDDTGAIRESAEGDNASPGWPITVGCLK